MDDDAIVGGAHPVWLSTTSTKYVIGCSDVEVGGRLLAVSKQIQHTYDPSQESPVANGGGYMRAVGERISGPFNVLVTVPSGLQLEEVQESTGSMHPLRVVHPPPTDERRRAARNQRNRAGRSGNPELEVIPGHWL